MSEHAAIWLQPWCNDCELNDASDTGRQWCQDDAWGKCDECDRRSVKYVLAPEQTKHSSGERE
jgi:hypothetical protein